MTFHIVKKDGNRIIQIGMTQLQLARFQLIVAVFSQQEKLLQLDKTHDLKHNND